MHYSRLFLLALLWPMLLPAAEPAAWLEASPEREVVKFPVDGEEVPALYRPDESGEARGGVVLLHDLGAHPDLEGVIGPLRRRLPRHGWHTLSVPLPAVESASSSALAPLLAAAWLADNPDTAAALVAIGLPVDERPEPAVDTLALLGRLEAPVLDIYGSRDLPAVVTSAERRRRAYYGVKAEQGLLRPGRVRFFQRPERDRYPYRQKRVPDANHDFTGHTESLLRHVRGWLERIPADSA